MSSLTSPVILNTVRHINDAGVDKISSGRLPAAALELAAQAGVPDAEKFVEEAGL
jgi:hypothetical protein